MYNVELANKSLIGLWVGDCIGNIGQLYNACDIIKALDTGICKLGDCERSVLDRQFINRFQYSDDTEEAIVLFNHLRKNGAIIQDELAMEFAKRYYERDRDGELFGYGLMTRKVLTDIYNGVPWKIANQTKPRIEGPSFVDKMLGGIVEGKTINKSMADVNKEIQEELKKEPQLKVGSCGNGSTMRVPPLGAFLFDKSTVEIIEQAKLQSEVTHCHPEGIAGAIAISLLSGQITQKKDLIDKGYVTDTTKERLYNFLLTHTPKGQVWDGIKKASELPLDTPLMKLIEILGNGTHVTCQDTVPLCIFLTIKALTQYKIEEMYEKVIIETSQCYGDVDTNCAIVGGMIGIISSPPTKWINYCQPMEGVGDDPVINTVKTPINKRFTGDQKNAIRDALKNTQTFEDEVGLDPSGTINVGAENEYYRWLAGMESTAFDQRDIVTSKELPPTFSEMIEKRFPGKSYRL